MSWRVAVSLQVLLAEINTLAPNRSKASDGSIGDIAHQQGWSDHNPNARGVVCARDFTHDPGDGADMHVLSRHLVARDHPALKYIIWNKRIWTHSYGWDAYGGSNPHTKHMHVSVGWGPDGRSAGDYDNASSWGVTNIGTDAGGDMLVSHGESGELVRYWQRLLNETGAGIKADGKYGDSTSRAVSKFWASVGGESFHGRSITSAVAMRIQQKALAGKAEPVEVIPVGEIVDMIGERLRAEV